MAITYATRFVRPSATTRTLQCDLWQKEGSPGHNGGEGEGGGLTSTAGAILTVINTTVAHNLAQGGEGKDGGYGGSGLGGGLYDSFNVTTAPPPGSPDTQLILLQGTIVSYNLAQGGEAEGSGRGGHNCDGETEEDGRDGHDYGSKAEGGSKDGLGIGGGVYHLGTYSAESTTVIKKNHASTSNDNIYP